MAERQAVNLFSKDPGSSILSPCTTLAAYRGRLSMQKTIKKTEINVKEPTVTK